MSRFSWLTTATSSNIRRMSWSMCANSENKPLHWLIFVQACQYDEIMTAMPPYKCIPLPKKSNGISMGNQFSCLLWRGDSYRFSKPALNCHWTLFHLCVWQRISTCHTDRAVTIDELIRTGIANLKISRCNTNRISGKSFFFGLFCIVAPLRVWGKIYLRQCPCWRQFICIPNICFDIKIIYFDWSHLEWTNNTSDLVDCYSRLNCVSGSIWFQKPLFISRPWNGREYWPINQSNVDCWRFSFVFYRYGNVRLRYFVKQYQLIVMVDALI